MWESLLDHRKQKEQNLICLPVQLYNDFTMYYIVMDNIAMNYLLLIIELGDATNKGEEVYA